MSNLLKSVFLASDHAIIKSGFEVQLDDQISMVVGGFGWGKNRSYLLKHRVDLVVFNHDESNNPMSRIQGRIESIRKTRKGNSANVSTPILVAVDRDLDISDDTQKGIFYAPMDIGWTHGEDIYATTTGDLVRRAAELMGIDYSYEAVPGRNTFKRVGQVQPIYIY